MLFYHPEKWHQEHRRPDSSRLSSPLAPHFFTDGVKLCSTNCLDIMFTEWGGVYSSPSLSFRPVMGERVTLCSWARKSSWKCIWHSDKLNLPHHLLQKKRREKKKKKRAIPQANEQRWGLARVTSAHLLLSSWFVLAWVFSRWTDNGYEPIWYNILPGSKIVTEGNQEHHCTFEI